MNNLGNADLIQQQFDLSQNLVSLIKELAQQGEALAQANYSYYRQKTSVAFRMKNDGLSATMIMQLIKGEPSVAVLMRERDIAEAKYKATQETINAVKLQIRMNDNQINREWSHVNGG